MKKELKDLLHILLEGIIANCKAGINNAIMDFDIEGVDFYSNYLTIALPELKHLKYDEEVDFFYVNKALDSWIWDAKSPKEKIKNIIEWYNQTDDLSGEYHPSDELLDELVELLEK